MLIQSLDHFDNDRAYVDWIIHMYFIMTSVDTASIAVRSNTSGAGYPIWRVQFKGTI